MRNGSGDEYFILFDPHGAIMKDFDHESAMSPWSADEERLRPGIFDDVPDEFQSFLSEPAFSIQETTFAFGEDTWIPHGKLGGLIILMKMILTVPSTCCRFSMGGLRPIRVCRSVQ